MASPQVPAVVNLATYKFCVLHDLRPLRRRLQAATQKLGIRGTILIAHEGINVFVSGRPESIDALQ
ncbi:MAG: sulfurtransferase, partial [Planctomycetota bacterium]